MKGLRPIACLAGWGWWTYSAKGLLSAVDSLPQLLERKKSLEVHTNILRAIFNTIAAREVPGEAPNRQSYAPNSVVRSSRSEPHGLGRRC